MSEADAIRPQCKTCGKNQCAAKGWRSGKRQYRAQCATCYKHRLGKSEPRKPACPIKAVARRKRRNRSKQIKRHPWLTHRKERCEDCGFVPTHVCQLDVDHSDGNKRNNNPSNLRTLCANCHRLKTYRCMDYLNRYASSGAHHASELIN